MTAIAGLWRLDGRPDAGENCARMLVPLRMYGRDASAAWSGGDVALGRQLQRILPEDIHDRQPLHGGKALVLVADVRIDNRNELAAALGISDERLRGCSDAAVLLAAYERWATDCFDRIIGDYACAIWDGTRRHMVLARDPLGMRPLNYHRTTGLFAFASMPKGLHALSEVLYAADEERIAEFLMLLPDTGSGTAFKGVEKVESGSFVVVSKDGFDAQRYWRPPQRTIRLTSPDDYAQALRERLDEAVACRLRGAPDVGVYLSAGYDSASVAATAARLLAPDGGRVRAFTSVPRQGYEDAAKAHRLADEGPGAAATTAMYPNMDHVLIRAGGRSPLDDLDSNFLLYEQPLLNLCNRVWISAINDAARDRKLRVMLTGSMGNMSLSYTGLELLPELVRAGRLWQWLREARALTAGTVHWRNVLARSFGPWVPGLLWRLANRFNGEFSRDILLYSMLRPGRSEELSLKARARERGLDLARRPWKDGVAMRLWAVCRGGSGALQKGTLAGWGLDLRDPTADRRLLEFCLATPTEQFLRGGKTRALARRALADRLPPEVLDAPLKGYQAADWHEGLTAARDNVAEEVRRLEACAPAARALATERMRRMVKDWPQSGWERFEVAVPYRHALLRGISAGHFLRRVAGANS